MARKPKLPKEVRAAEKPKGDAERLELWKRRIAQAQKRRKEWVQRYKVEMAEQYFLGMQDATTVYNHMAATIRTSRPSLFFQTPKFFVRAKPKKSEPATERTAAIGEGVMEEIARQDDHLEIAGNLAVLQAFFRIGVLKVCYDPRMEPNPAKGEIIYQTNANGEPIKDAEGNSVPMIDPLTGEPVKSPAEVLTDEVYRWRWVNAANMLLPDEGPDRTVWPWIGEEITVTLEDAKNDPRFDAGLRKSLQANASTRMTPDKRTRNEDRETEDLFRYCECYDIMNKRWYVWADGQTFDNFLVDEPFPKWIDNDPYALLMLGDPIIGSEPSAWPKPVVFDWLGPQKEYNLRRQQINEGCKRAARKGIYQEGAFDDPDEAVKVMQSPDDMEWAKGDPNKVKILETPPMNMDVWRDLPALQTDWRIITHQTGARLADPDASTATEATFTERAANLVDSDMQQIVLRWMGEAGRKMWQCIRGTLTVDLWVKIREMTDKEFQAYAQRVYGLDPLVMQAMPGLKEAIRQRIGAEKWMPVTREQLQFEGTVSVVPGSTRPKNLDVERRNWLEFLKILAQGPQLALSRELLRYTAEKFDIDDERLLDELVALAQKMIAVNSNQAGRNQGGSNGNGGGTATGDILAQVTGGAR